MAPHRPTPSPSLRQAVLGLLRRELTLTARRRGDAATGLLFFFVVASLFPLAMGADARRLAEMGPGVVWVSALLASLLSLPRLFVADLADGTLEQLLLRPHPLSVLALTKVVAHWLGSGAPVVLASPVLALQYGLSAEATLLLMATLALGTPALSLVGAIGAALSLGLRGSGMLTALIVLPLNVPILIFGSGAVAAQLGGADPAPWLSLLGAVLALSVAAAPWALAHSLRIACE